MVTTNLLLLDAPTSPVHTLELILSLLSTVFRLSDRPLRPPFAIRSVCYSPLCFTPPLSQLHRPRLAAWLEIAGEPVSLLDPRLAEDTNTVCTCVEASAEQEYVIAYRLEMDRPEEADVCVDVTVDGKA